MVSGKQEELSVAAWLDLREQLIAVLYESGWDEIFYPDEMDQLVKAIG